MEILSASDAKREFGEVILKAQQAPVGINKNGKPVAVMVSATEYKALEQMKTDLLRQELSKGIADIEAGDIVSSTEVFAGLRKQVSDAKL